MVPDASGNTSDSGRCTAMNASCVNRWHGSFPTRRGSRWRASSGRGAHFRSASWCVYPAPCRTDLAAAERTRQRHESPEVVLAAVP